MAACGSLQHIFEKSLPEKQPAASATLIESLSSSTTTWNQMTPLKQPPHHHHQQQQQQSSSFFEMFGELHFNPASDNQSSSSSFPMSSLSSSSSPSPLSSLLDLNISSRKIERSFASMNSENHVHSFKYHRKSDSFSLMNSESLQLCTEGLGFESFDDVEDMKNEMSEEGWQNQQEKVSVVKNSPRDNLGSEFIRRSRSTGGEFPPPISSIGKSGKPWVCFKSYRHDGRFVLKEIRIPSQEFLHACREDGRLKLQFVQPNDDIQELEEEEEEESEEDEVEVEVDEEEEENRNIHDDDDGGEEEREANDTTKYEAGNDLQCRGLQV